MSTTMQTRERGYTNIPPYETGPGVRVPANARYAFATRLPYGQGPVVMQAYRFAAEARRQRTNAQHRHEWVSHLLERVGPREWVPVNPRIRAGYTA